MPDIERAASIEAPIITQNGVLFISPSVPQSQQEYERRIEKIETKIGL